MFTKQDMCFTEHVHFYYSKRNLRCLSNKTTTELLNMLISYIIRNYHALSMNKLGCVTYPPELLISFFNTIKLHGNFLPNNMSSANVNVN